MREKTGGEGTAQRRRDSHLDVSGSLFSRLGSRPVSVGVEVGAESQVRSVGGAEGGMAANYSGGEASRWLLGGPGPVRCGCAHSGAALKWVQVELVPVRCQRPLERAEPPCADPGQICVWLHFHSVDTKKPLVFLPADTLECDPESRAAPQTRSVGLCLRSAPLSSLCSQASSFFPLFCRGTRKWEQEDTEPQMAARRS